MLERLGADPRPIDRDPDDVFASGGYYATCPRCHRFAMLSIDPDGGWRSVCPCWPNRRHDALDLILLARHAA